jgi:hypothetical protein
MGAGLTHGLKAFGSRVGLAGQPATGPSHGHLGWVAWGTDGGLVTCARTRRVAKGEKRLDGKE